MIRAAMSNVPLVDAVALASRKDSWRHTVAAHNFVRLAQAAEFADVEVDVRFALDDHGRPHATGACRLVAKVCCCRCLREEPVDVASRIDIRVVASEAEAQALMPELDAVVSDAAMPIAELIEDDLLMSLPEIACKDRETCPHVPVAVSGDGVSADHDGEDRKRPFAALAALKDSLGAR